MLIIFSAIVAVFAHSFFINQAVNEGHIMGGTGDQTYQMVLFKDYLYKQFSNGNFFYSFTFNGGGNFFTNLSYYYSTSMVYYLTVLITFILETIGVLSNIGVSYWANSIMIISIVRSFVILIITTKLIEYFNVKRPIAFLGATFYAVSVIYFRHVILWEFFADAMIWLPILIYGAEKIIRKESGTIFSIGVFLAMFNNGYFAYKSFLFLILYIILRLVVRLTESEASVFTQLKNYLFYGVMGGLMSLPGFIPFVIGFFNTSRLSPEFDIAWSNVQINHFHHFLFTDNAFIIPTLFLVLACTFYLYRNKTFRFFSLLSIGLILFRYNPQLASITNGLSYPQYRWMYVLYLFIAIAIGVGIQYIHENINQVKLRQSLSWGIVTAGAIYLIVYFIFRNEFEYSSPREILVFALLQLAITMIYLTWSKLKIHHYIFFIILLSVNAIFAANEQFLADYALRTEAYFVNHFDDENHRLKQAIDFIKNDADGFYRIDYYKGNNFTLPYEVSTFNIYSSFQNKNQQYFERDFQILSDIDSNGEYSGLGKRRILNGLFKVDYIIASDWHSFRVPAGYEEVAEFNNVKVYKNTRPFTFIHPVREVYDSKDFHSETFKDELILNAVITDDIEKTAIHRNNQSLIAEVSYELHLENIQYEDDILYTANENQVVIAVEEELPETGSVILEYSLEPLDSQGEFKYIVNGYEMELKGAGLAYAEQRFRNRLPVHRTSDFTFELDEETDYFFKIHNVHYVSEEAISNRLEEEENFNYSYSVNKDSIVIEYDNDANYPLMVLPVFDELGWKVQVNGENTELLNVNSGMIGFEIPEGKVRIELQFHQPYLIETIVLAVVGLLGLIIMEKVNKSTDNKIENIE